MLQLKIILSHSGELCNKFLCADVNFYNFSETCLWNCTEVQTFMLDDYTVTGVKGSVTGNPWTPNIQYVPENTI